MAGDAIEIRQVESYEPAVFDDLVRRNLESNQLFIATRELRREGDTSYRARTIRLGAFDGDALVGLSWGQAMSPSRFGMNMSLVTPSHRGRGIYTRLLTAMLEATTDFDAVDSYHQLWNNNIIAIKLRRGFSIVGIDHSIAVGPRLILRHYHNPALRELMEYRVGLRPDPRAD